MSDIFNKLLILRTPGIGPVKYADLIRKFGSAQAAAETLNNISAIRDVVLREMETAQKNNIYYISDEDEEYPCALKEVKNHPPVITVRGNIKTLQKPVVSIVGTRHATAAGIRIASELGKAFAENGYAVASGMAIGTDSAAHIGALQSDGDSQTVAVVAGGADYIWPLENESLYWKIVERGAVISEMPVGFVPVATNFVQRNRWVAGICEKLILGEADLKSGSMTTVRFGIDYGRDIYAIPSHPLDSRALGPNSLIQSGKAKLCMGAEDFFKNEKNVSDRKKSLEKNEKEISLLDALGTIPVSESVLAQIVKKSISEIKSNLVVLELQGLVKKVDGGYIRI